jgi:hypothetical protein
MKMQTALCNATAEGEHGHIHICTLEHGHKSRWKAVIVNGKEQSQPAAHYCKCGAFFASVKKSDIERAGKTLQKTQ